MKKDKSDKLSKIRHSSAHILAQAVMNLYKGVKLAIGPAIDNGFYYDFEFPKAVKISKNDLPAIKNEMIRIIKEKQEFVRSDKSIDEAISFLKERNQPYSRELAEDLKKQGHESVSFYKNGNFINLCSGPHVKSSDDIRAVKLLSVAGAYWKGDEKNKMLVRIYGTAFESEKELVMHLENLKKAKQNDHRKLGKQLDLFCFSDLVGPGLPLYTPKGSVIIEELQKHIEKVCRKYGFEKVITPHIAKINLYKLSGHAEKYPEEILHVSSERYKDWAMKPVQCPHQAQIYASRPRSYKELPIRYMESNKQYRGEKPGELRGLERVIAITVEDGHSFCRVDQVKEEVKIIVRIIKEFFEALGLWQSKWVSLSVRDYENLDKYIGDSKEWDICEKLLQEVSDEMKLDARVCEGEAAVYGPKLDFMFKDALGRDVQIPTVQVDFASPGRFQLSYIDEKGKEVPPVMVHRAILGSYERLLVVLLEHFGGALPLWLSPVQVVVLPVSEKQSEYARDLCNNLKTQEIRVELNDKSNPLSARIREAQMQKIPYIVVVGDKEAKNKSISVRMRDGKQVPEMQFEKFVEDIKKEIEDKALKTNYNL
ncbi:MAG: threonine--tRNA ligase [Patescibacteria group bacterium]|nr:threonine--tRNA ligase [Patescibacteria group bacterium]